MKSEKPIGYQHRELAMIVLACGFLLSGCSRPYDYGLINRDGKIVLPAKPYYINEFSEGLAEIEIDGKSGVIDDRGEMVIPPIFNRVFPFSEGVAKFIRGDEQGLIDRKGKILFKTKDFSIWSPVGDGLVRVVRFDRQKKSRKVGYIDTSGRLVIPFQFESATQFSKGVAFAQLLPDKKYGLIDRTGRWIKQPFASDDVFFDFPGFGEGPLEVHIDNRYVLMNEHGDEIPPPNQPCLTYSGNMPKPRIGRFSNGLCPFEFEGNWGYFDASGQVVIPAKFHEVGGFQQGVALVRDILYWNVIDQKGNLVLKTDCFESPILYGDRIIFQKTDFIREHWTMYNLKGRVIFQSQPYEIMGPFQNGVARFRVRNLFF
jgi:hypothetical protein